MQNCLCSFVSALAHTVMNIQTNHYTGVVQAMVASDRHSDSCGGYSRYAVPVLSTGLISLTASWLCCSAEIATLSFCSVHAKRVLNESVCVNLPSFLRLRKKVAVLQC